MSKKVLRVKFGAKATICRRTLRKVHLSHGIHRFGIVVMDFILSVASRVAQAVRELLGVLDPA
jgi:hypothetical protein